MKFEWKQSLAPRFNISQRFLAMVIGNAQHSIANSPSRSTVFAVLLSCIIMQRVVYNHATCGADRHWTIPCSPKWGLCDYAIVHTKLPPSPVILWIELGGKLKWLPLNFCTPRHNMHRPQLVSQLSTTQDKCLTLWDKMWFRCRSDHKSGVGKHRKHRHVDYTEIYLFYTVFSQWEWQKKKKKKKKTHEDRKGVRLYVFTNFDVKHMQKKSITALLKFPFKAILELEKQNTAHMSKGGVTTTTWRRGTFAKQ